MLVRYLVNSHPCRSEMIGSESSHSKYLPCHARRNRVNFR